MFCLNTKKPAACFTDMLFEGLLIVGEVVDYKETCFFFKLNEQTFKISVYVVKRNTYCARDDELKPSLCRFPLPHILIK